MTDRVEGAGPEDREIDTEVKWDFVPRSSLPAGFVSLDAVKAVVVTPLDDMKRATENGLKLYWLGETFETEPLKDFAPPWGETPAELTYGHDDPLSDPVLITVDEYTPQGWSEHAGDHRCQGWRSLPSETETAVSGFEATFCELAWMSAPPPAQGGEGDSEGFTPTAPNDDCVIRQLIIHFPDSVVVVSSGSGLCGTNPYGNRGELLRLGASLRPFEAPTP